VAFEVVKKIFDFYINSSIHVALAVISLCLVTSLHFGGQVELSLLIFIFFSVITGYNFVKYAGVAGLHHRTLTRGLQNIQIFSFLCFLGLLVSAFFVDVKILLLSAIFGSLTALYALPVFSKKRNLRSISGLKIFIIGIVWAGVTVILPVTGVKNVILEDLFVELFQRFLLVLVWILPFEIRDLKYDLEQLGTLPQRIGVTQTKIVGLLLLAIVMVTDFLKASRSQASFQALVLMCLLTGAFVMASKENRSRYFTAFWVEAIPVFWLIILWVLSVF
jgi:hypothetical protein